MSKYFKIYIVPLTLILALSITFLFFIKNKVAHLGKELQNVNMKILQEKDSIHILKAEYSYITNPKRIRKLSDRYLNLVSPAKDQIYNPDAFEAYLATLSPAIIKPENVEAGKE